MGMLIAVAIGGAAGSALRFLLSKFIQGRTGIDFPVGTFVVNTIGAFLIGLAFSLLVERITLPLSVRALIITGFLGGFTTFSTFSYESYNLLMDGETGRFLLYVFGTNGICILMSALGYNLGRLL